MLYHNTGSNRDLDSNHNFFILVDDGTVHKYGGEIDMRTALEREFSTAQRTPIVTIVIQGGPNTIRCVCAMLKMCLEVRGPCAGVL